MSGTRDVVLCADDLAVGDARRVDVEGLALCLVRCADGYRAVSDTCSHEDFSLADGIVDPDICEIECGLHGSLFSLISGEPQTFPATQPVAVYEVAVEGADVVVRLP